MRSGETIGNRFTGETLTMIESEEENGGIRQLYRVHLPPHRLGPPLHYHVAFTERFTAIEGILDMYLDRQRRHVRLRAGESMTAGIRQPHTFANESDAACVMTVETRPPGGVVRAFQLAYALANAGEAGDDGLPRNPILRLRFIDISQGFLVAIPLPVQRAVFGAARVISMLAGRERSVRRSLT